MAIHDKKGTNESAQCPHPQRLRDWLDERLDLDASEIEHINACSLCEGFLEQYSDNPRLKEMSNRPVTGRATGGFELEPELKEIQERVLAPKLARSKQVPKQPPS